jgi:hypothetical protein
MLAHHGLEESTVKYLKFVKYLNIALFKELVISAATSYPIVIELMIPSTAAKTMKKFLYGKV